MKCGGKILSRKLFAYFMIGGMQVFSGAMHACYYTVKCDSVNRNLDKSAAKCRQKAWRAVTVTLRRAQIKM